MKKMLALLAFFGLLGQAQAEPVPFDVTIPSQTLTVPGQALTFTVDVPKTTQPFILATDVGIIPNDGINDVPAINAILENAKKGTTILFPAGIYDLASTVRITDAQNLTLQGVDGAKFRKMERFSGEYMFWFRNGQDIALDGLDFEGLTTDTQIYRWGEQGLCFEAVKGLRLTHLKARNIGDAVIRITSPVNSQVVTEDVLIQDNYFENISQLTTTQAGGGGSQGGARNVMILNNRFKNLKGSIKFAARQAGSEGFVVQGNIVEGNPNIPTSHGLEIVSTSNVLASNNIFRNQGGAPLTVYVNEMSSLTGWDFGNITFAENLCINPKVGIRFSGGRYGDGYVPTLPGLRAPNNTVVGLPTGRPALIWVNGAMAAPAQ